MNLYTSEGLAMIDTNSKIVQLHRATEMQKHCPPPRRWGKLWADFKKFWIPEYVNPHGVILLALMALAAALVIAIGSMLIGWGREEISRMDWQAVAQLLGSKR